MSQTDTLTPETDMPLPEARRPRTLRPELPWDLQDDRVGNADRVSWR